MSMEGPSQNITEVNKAVMEKMEQDALQKRLQKFEIELQEAKGNPQKLAEVQERMKIAGIKPSENEKIEVSM